MGTQYRYQQTAVPCAAQLRGGRSPACLLGFPCLLAWLCLCLCLCVCVCLCAVNKQHVILWALSPVLYISLLFWIFFFLLSFFLFGSLSLLSWLCLMYHACLLWPIAPSVFGFAVGRSRSPRFAYQRYCRLSTSLICITRRSFLFSSFFSSFLSFHSFLFCQHDLLLLPSPISRSQSLKYWLLCPLVLNRPIA